LAFDHLAMAARLRQLRMNGIGGKAVSQRAVACALGVSVPLISSWENGNAMPPEDRLTGYARLFATDRSMLHNEARLVELTDFSDEERDRFNALIDELRQLRPATSPADERVTRSPWEGMWNFPDKSPVTLVCARLPDALRAAPDGPDYVELASYADLDALMELHGHVYAANPGVVVNHRLADSLRQEDITNHLVLLGGMDGNALTGRVMRALDLPVTQTRDSFIAGDQVFRSTVEENRLVEDVAQFCRGPNPFNRKRTVTICNGNYGRGTYAAVRTLTDPRFRDRNRVYLEERYGPDDTYSILSRVDVIAGEVITPDWTHDGTVLHEWSRP
jgi:transcriptional regulator with XRE-family HTH domain